MPTFLRHWGSTKFPRKGTLRQRMDAFSAEFRAVIEEAAMAFLQRSETSLTPLGNGLMPLDCDVTAV